MLKKIYYFTLIYSLCPFQAKAWISELNFSQAHSIDVQNTDYSVKFFMWIANGICLLLSFFLLLECGKRMKDQDFHGAFKSFLGAIIVAISGRLAVKMLYY